VETDKGHIIAAKRGNQLNQLFQRQLKTGSSRYRLSTPRIRFPPSGLFSAKMLFMGGLFRKSATVANIHLHTLALHSVIVGSYSITHTLRVTVLFCLLLKIQLVNVNIGLIDMRLSGLGMFMRQPVSS
jgi:hypothetical protein